MVMSHRPLDILFISSEVTPFSKTGGLADVSGALPHALANRGCRVRVLSPHYGTINHKIFEIIYAQEIGTFSIDISGRSLQGSFSRLENSDSSCELFFVNCDPLYNRPGIYNDPETNTDYIDNDYRFDFLCRAAFEFCRLTNSVPDIFHCNDWQSALIAYYLNAARDAHGLKDSRSLLTIHNIAYHGSFPPEAVNRIVGAAKHYYPGGPFEYHGRVNLLKTGLEFADALNTVSPTYAQEIRSSSEYGYGMESVLQARPDGVAGILNGLDVEVWSPANERRIPAPYSADNLERKVLNKKALCTRIGLPYEENTLLIGMISRITVQKGFEILLQALPELMTMPCRFVLLGSGDLVYESVLRELSLARPDRFQLRIGYDDDLAHLIEAGADAFIMPSKYEPCGLNQMMSMRYGTPPIVRATGGLADTVTDADADPAAGTGFVFTNFDKNDLLHAVHRALSAFSNKWRWRQIQKNGMARDFSWNHSAEQYINLYEQCLENPPRIVSGA